jgi:hypothetical protein
MLKSDGTTRRTARTDRSPHDNRTDAQYEALERPGGVTDREWEIAKYIARSEGHTGRSVYRAAGDICLYDYHRIAAVLSLCGRTQEEVFAEMQRAEEARARAAGRNPRAMND